MSVRDVIEEKLTHSLAPTSAISAPGTACAKQTVCSRSAALCWRIPAAVPVTIRAEVRA